MRNNMYCNFTQRHLFTDNELLMAHVWPSIESLDPLDTKNNIFARPPWMATGSTSVSRRQFRNMTGNGMRLALIASWFVYCVAHTARATLIDGFCVDLCHLRSGSKCSSGVEADLKHQPGRRTLSGGVDLEA